ncbi:aspartyl-phosphate phosphatase Spo0E family protein [Priestia sp. OVS21]|nr:aspartyl-phosphate phosphatase Spo0E family protein [Priestia sp. OVS21]MCJ7992611.1 aspartyl-phosphate phosphatase Spo0E family protein [Priestia sp. OVS21]
MYELTKYKSFSDPDVIKISQQLEIKIQNIKNMSRDIRSF